MAAWLTNPADEFAQQKKLLAELLLQSSQTESYPASLAQKRLWFLDQLEPKTAAYNVHLGLWLRGPLDIDALRVSLQELMNRHASLRTGFRLEDGELLQIVIPNVTVNLEVTDISDSTGPYAAAYQLAETEVETIFDLANAPLFRARLIRVTANDHVLLCTMHHIITDSWSTQILAKELSTLYSALSNQQPSPLPELPISYGDYSEWQSEWFKTATVQQQLAFWKDKLQDAPPVLELRMQRSRSSEQTFKGSSQTLQLSDEIVAGIKTLAMRLEVTPFMLFLAAFKILLYRASGQPDLLIGAPIAGRNLVETEGLVGFFVNTLVLRDYLGSDPTFQELVAQIRETTLQAFANADVPFEKVVEILQPERNLSYNPIFQVMFSVIKSALQSHAFADLTAFPYVVTPTTSILDLIMAIIEGVDGHWWAQIDHNTDLFSSEDVSRLLSSYTTLLQAIIASPERRIGDFQIADFPALKSENTRMAGEGPKENRSFPAQVNSTRHKISRPSTAGSPRFGRPNEPLQSDEQQLLDIWKNVLRLPRLGIDDNFFEIGGHSLLAAQLIAQIRTTTGRKIAVSAVFRAPTIRSFAKLLREDALAKPDPIVMKLGGGSTKTVPFFAVAAPGVDTFGFAQLARHLPPQQSLFKLQASAPVVIGRPMTEEELKTLGMQYIDAMRSEQPHGPYCLGAMCEGVLIAQQMILQLESAGEEIALFTIFDTWVLENSQIRPLWALDYYWQRFRDFRILSRTEMVAAARRVGKRMTSRSKVTPGSGWNRAYWPGESFQNPQFQAPVLLFKRPRQPYFYIRDPQMGWGARSMGGVTICEVKCGHVEMLREPHVRSIGQTLGNRLKRIAQADRLKPTG
jgi:thioesterase domain-containing protein